MTVLHPTRLMGYLFCLSPAGSVYAVVYTVYINTTGLCAVGDSGAGRAIFVTVWTGRGGTCHRVVLGRSSGTTAGESVLGYNTIDNSK